MEEKIRSRATLLLFSILLCLYAPFSLFVCARFHGHGQGMDVQDIKVASFVLGTCDKVYCHCEKASSGSEAGTHCLSV
jgi:hypothetical protein